jgi:predicted NBD/HSP70 family sugar kinase
MASGPAIISLVGDRDGAPLTLGGVIALAAEGDVRCRRALSDAGREIGIAIAGLCNLINPERVVIGGLLSRAGDLVLDPIRGSIRRYAIQAAAGRVEVVPAVFVERAELLGSLALALRSSNAAFAASMPGA